MLRRSIVKLAFGLVLLGHGTNLPHLTAASSAAVPTLIPKGEGAFHRAAGRSGGPGADPDGDRHQLRGRRVRRRPPSSRSSDRWAATTSTLSESTRLMKVRPSCPSSSPWTTAALSPLLSFRRAGRQRALGLAGSVLQLAVGCRLARAVHLEAFNRPSSEAGPRRTASPSWSTSSRRWMVLLSGVIAVVTSIYSLSDIDRGRREHGFYPLMHALEVGTNGVFVTGDLFNLYVWFEVTLIASFVLLVLGNERPQMQGAIGHVAMNLISSASLPHRPRHPLRLRARPQHGRPLACCRSLALPIRLHPGHDLPRRVRHQGRWSSPLLLVA